MPVQFPEIRKFDGLYLQANSFNVPDGALEQAENVLISKDNKISKRRGNYNYDSPVATANNLRIYQDRLISIFTDGIGYYTDTGVSPNETGNLATLTGETVSVTGSRISRSVEANKNFYFTTDNGPYKLEAYDGKVYKAGVPPGLDLRGIFRSENGPLNADAQVAYRVVFGRRDANDNLLLGAPSDILVFTNFKFTSQSYSASGTVVTVTTTSAHNLSTGMTITVENATDSTYDGTYTVTVTGAFTYTYNKSGGAGSGSLTYSNTRSARLEISIPSEIDNATDGYFFQIYRSSQTNSETTTPSSDFKLIDEREITSAEVASNVAFYDDVIPDILLGAELYTNPNSREGELQANNRPPLCDDITFYKNHVVYSGVQSRHVLDFSLIDTSAINNNDYLEIQVNATTRRYVARSGVANNLSTSESVSGTGTVTITYTAHGLLDGDTVYISNVSGSVPEGSYTVSGATANTFDITSSGNSATSVDFEGVTDISGYYIFYFDTASGSVSVQLRDTAQAIVKAINKDDSSLVYARYTSGLTEIPGEIRLLAKGFTGTISIRASSTSTGNGFSPALTDAFGNVESSNDDQPHVFYVSKIGEPEAVPLVNFFPAGSRNKRLLRSVALRDSIILLKEDGVYRATGDTVNAITVTALDTTVFCVAPNSVEVINNQVIFLSNQGVCLVTESSVQIISRKIEDVIQPILGKTGLSANTFGIAYESERLYLLSTYSPNTLSNDVVYVYNILNDTWTTSDATFVGGVVDANDVLHTIDTSNNILRERKNQTRIDYCGQNYTATINSITVDNFGANITVSGGYVPRIGDVIVKNNVFNRIDSVDASGSNYNVSFIRATNLEALDSVQLYAYYTSTVKLSPYHAGLVGRHKQFSQMQIHLRSNAISRLSITFTGPYFGGSDAVDWAPQSAGEGWGFDAWGFFGWGQEEGINLSFETKPAPIIRLYIPRFQQRNTYIQPVLDHAQAGESLEIQAIAFAVRAYKERVAI